MTLPLPNKLGQSFSSIVLESHRATSSTKSLIERKVESVAQTQINVQGKAFSDSHGRSLADDYFWEAVPVNGHHYYKDQIKSYVDKWAKSSANGETKASFQEWMSSQDKKKLKEVRYFNDDDRDATQVVIDKDGKLKQQGLDSSLEADLTPLNGEYAFVIGRDEGYLHLHAAKKEGTPKGKVQHSSFFRGGDVRSAGMINVKEGIIQEIRAQSGHYQPTKIELARVVEYVKGRLTDKDFAKIEVECQARGNAMVARAAFSPNRLGRLTKKMAIKRISASDFYEREGKELAKLKEEWIEMRQLSQ